MRNPNVLIGVFMATMFALAAGFVASTPWTTYDNIEYDLSQCDWVVKDIKDGPDNWKEITQTPGGNWCIREQ